MGDLDQEQKEVLTSILSVLKKIDQKLDRVLSQTPSNDRTSRDELKPADSVGAKADLKKPTGERPSPPLNDTFEDTTLAIPGGNGAPGKLAHEFKAPEKQILSPKAEIFKAIPSVAPAASSKKRIYEPSSLLYKASSEHDQRILEVFEPIKESLFIPHDDLVPLSFSIESLRKVSSTWFNWEIAGKEILDAIVSMNENLSFLWSDSFDDENKFFQVMDFYKKDILGDDVQQVTVNDVRAFGFDRTSKL